MTDREGVAACQWRLAYVWFSGAGAILAILVAQTVYGTYGGQVQKVWSWFMAAVLPTLTLMIGSLAYEARVEPAGAGATVDRRMYRLSQGLSILYLFLVFAAVIARAFPIAVSPVEFMEQSNLWLLPTQGFVSGALGAFFVSRKN